MIKFRLNDEKKVLSDYEKGQRWYGVLLGVSYLTASVATTMLTGTVYCFYMLMGMMGFGVIFALISCYFDPSITDRRDREELRPKYILEIFGTIGILSSLCFIMKLVFPFILKHVQHLNPIQ